MRILITIAFMVLTNGLPVYAGDQNDIELIKETAMNYMKSWYHGDAKMMKESIHSNLAKRSLRSTAEGKIELRRTTAADMISYTENGYGKDLLLGNSTIEVVPLDIYKDIASVKVITPHYWEYLHLAKFRGKWEIVNALYERRSPMIE